MEGIDHDCTKGNTVDPRGSLNIKRTWVLVKKFDKNSQELHVPAHKVLVFGHGLKFLSVLRGTNSKTSLLHFLYFVLAVSHHS